MTGFDAGDVVLVLFPFTDLTTHKKRPAVVLSPRAYSDRLNDIVVMPLTSQPDANSSLTLSRWKDAGLIKPTWVKPLIGTLSLRLVERRLGRLNAVDTSRIEAALAILLDKRWA